MKLKVLKSLKYILSGIKIVFIILKGLKEELQLQECTANYFLHFLIIKKIVKHRFQVYFGFVYN